MSICIKCIHHVLCWSSASLHCKLSKGILGYIRLVNVWAITGCTACLNKEEHFSENASGLETGVQRTLVQASSTGPRVLSCSPFSFCGTVLDWSPADSSLRPDSVSMSVAFFCSDDFGLESSGLESPVGVYERRVSFSSIFSSGPRSYTRWKRHITMDNNMQNPARFFL